jgi:hypothetical protein
MSSVNGTSLPQADRIKIDDSTASFQLARLPEGEVTNRTDKAVFVVNSAKWVQGVGNVAPVTKLMPGKTAKADAVLLDTNGDGQPNRNEPVVRFMDGTRNFVMTGGNGDFVVPESIPDHHLRWTGNMLTNGRYNQQSVDQLERDLGGYPVTYQGRSLK